MVREGTNTNIAAETGGKLADVKAKTDLIGASVALETGGLLAAVKTKTDNLGATVALETGGLLAAVKTKTDNLPAAPAGSTDPGTMFALVITGLLQSNVTTAGIILTGACSGILELQTLYIMNGSTPFDSPAHTAAAKWDCSNTRGSIGNQPSLPISGLIANSGASKVANMVIYNGCTIRLYAGTESFNTAGNFDMVLIFRRLTAGSTIAAA